MRGSTSGRPSPGLGTTHGPRHWRFKHMAPQKVSLHILLKLRRSLAGVLRFPRMEPGKPPLTTCHPQASKGIEGLDPKEEGTVRAFASLISPRAALEVGLWETRLLKGRVLNLLPQFPVVPRMVFRSLQSAGQASVPGFSRGAQDPEQMKPMEE